MVRSYDRHGPVESFSLIASSTSNSVFDGKLAFCPALEDVLVWNLKKGELLHMWHATGVKDAVTCIARSSAVKDTFAVGYSDGSIRLWSHFSQQVKTTFQGHRNAITALAFDKSGTRLASGSQDTDVILWDIVAESGLYRLKGHKDQITALEFINDSHLLSTSKDTLFKLWDLSSQHCISTLVAHRTPIWSLAICHDTASQQWIAITSASEGSIKAWSVDPAVIQGDANPIDNKPVTQIGTSELKLETASHAQKVRQIQWHSSEPLVAILTADRTIEILRVRNEEEMAKKQARKKKREREKGKAVAAEAEEDEAWTDRLVTHCIVRATSKVRSFDFGPLNVKNRTEISILCALANNSVETFTVSSQPSKPAPTPALQHSLTLQGHRSDIRSLAVSSDDTLLLSASAGSLKLWNIRTTKPLRTIEDDIGYALCSTFLPGDRHALIGNKEGFLVLVDLGSSQVIQTVKGHEGAVWSLDLQPDGRGFVTGSADKDVKFWKLEISETQSSDAAAPPKRQLTMSHSKTLRMTDDILAVKYSPDSRLLAVSLLDSTVKVFYSDSLKFFLSLYGHKLPVLSMDISSDSKLIITSSADKNIKIWGLDFGDCHRSLFAHDDSVMCVKFEAASHYFWSVGKDKLVKYWDGDKFDLIQKLEGHHSEVWALAVSRQGKFAISASHDKSIRIWEKLDEPLFLEEEREKELEALYDEPMERTQKDRDALNALSANGESTGPEATLVSRSDAKDSLVAGERIVEALQASDEDFATLQAYEKSVANGEKPPARVKNPVLAIYGECEAQEYVLKVVQRIQSAALDDALMVLPFAMLGSMLRHCSWWAEKRLNIPLTARIVQNLLQIHHSQLVSNSLMKTTLITLSQNLRTALSAQKDTLGYNLAALRYMQRTHVQEKIGKLWELEGDEDKVRQKIEEARPKRKRAVKA